MVSLHWTWPQGFGSEGQGTPVALLPEGENGKGDTFWFYDKSEGQFSKTPYGPLGNFITDEIDSTLDVIHLSDTFLVNTFDDQKSLKKIAQEHQMEVPDIIVYNFDTTLIEEAKQVPGYEIIPIPVMNILMDYGKNYIGSVNANNDDCGTTNVFNDTQQGPVNASTDRYCADNNHLSQTRQESTNPHIESNARKSPDENDDFDKVEVIFNVLLKNPEHFEVFLKPSGERNHNFMCTMNVNKIPIEKARADDNGAFKRRGNTYRYYYVTDEVCLLAHKHGEKGTFYYNERVCTGNLKKPQYNKIEVDINDVYLLQRQYRYSKSNDFCNIITFLKKCATNELYPYYMYLNKWTKEPQEPETFIVERHGNAKKPYANPYYKKDPSLLEGVRKRLSNKENPGKIYIDLSKNIDTALSVSNILDKPRVIYNQNNILRNKDKNPSNIFRGKSNYSEYETLVTLVKDESFVQSVTADKFAYMTTNFLPYMINDMERFCVVGDSPWVVDTTFKVADDLWLTDSSYTNFSLLNEDNKHPQFPGPSQWHFKKDQSSFRRLACEMVTLNPKLLKIKKIGHDLDTATANGLGDIMISSTHLWCTQHLQKADIEKLKQLGANGSTREKIMGDIYGYQTNTFECQGLADAEDETDLDVKLESLRCVWENLVPGFFDFFRQYRVRKFKECLILSARESLNIKGRFYSNELELMHKLLKKQLDDNNSGLNVMEVSHNLTKWLHDSYLSETRKALIGQGKFRLAEGYHQFFVDPTEWVRWSSNRKVQHFESFQNFVPKPYDTYVKPSEAGRKRKPGEKRRSLLPEPDIFRELQLPEPSAVTPVKLRRTENRWEVDEKVPSGIVDIFDPFRTSSKLYYLVHRGDGTNFPSKVKRCEDCRVMFTSCDVIAVKTTAMREYTDKSGVKKRHTGNVYLHYLTNCLKNHDQKFDFKSVVVLKKTCSLLTFDQVTKLVNNGCTIEK